MMLTLDLYVALIVLRNVPSLPNFLNIIKMIFYQMLSLHQSDHMVFILQFLNMVYHIYWCVYVELFIAYRLMIFLMCCWIQLAIILLRIFFTCVHQGY